MVLLRIFNFSAMVAAEDSDDQRNKPGGSRKKEASIFGGRRVVIRGHDNYEITGELNFSKDRENGGIYNCHIPG
jgi:hypothetical protein